MLAHEFMRNAFLAGTFVALACGLVGYFVVLRGQVFAGDALSHVAFTGALAAAAAGIDIRLGLFAATIAVAVGIGLLGERARPDDVVIGSVFAWVLGLGALFLSIFVSGSSGADGTAAVRVLFGSILGLSAADARLAAAIAIAAALALLAIARPLLFASLDPEVARGLGAAGARRSASASSSLLGVVAAEATQAVGALLLLGRQERPRKNARGEPFVAGRSSTATTQATAEYAECDESTGGVPEQFDSVLGRERRFHRLCRPTTL